MFSGFLHVLGIYLMSESIIVFITGISFIGYRRLALDSEMKVLVRVASLPLHHQAITLTHFALSAGTVFDLSHCISCIEF